MQLIAPAAMDFSRSAPEGLLTQNRVAIAGPSLPEEVNRQGVTTKKKSTSMVLMVSLYSPDQSLEELYLSNYVATQVKDVLARVDGDPPGWIVYGPGTTHPANVEGGAMFMIYLLPGGQIEWHRD